MNADILILISSFLNISDVIPILLVCKSWKEVSEFDIFWKNAYHNFLKMEMNRLDTTIHENDVQMSSKKKKMYQSKLQNVKKSYEMLFHSSSSTTQSSSSSSSSSSKPSSSLSIPISNSFHNKGYKNHIPFYKMFSRIKVSSLFDEYSQKILNLSKRKSITINEFFNHWNEVIEKLKDASDHIASCNRIINMDKRMNQLIFTCYNLCYKEFYRKLRQINRNLREEENMFDIQQVSDQINDGYQQEDDILNDDSEISKEMEQEYHLYMNQTMEDLEKLNRQLLDYFYKLFHNFIHVLHCHPSIASLTQLLSAFINTCNQNEIRMYFPIIEQELKYHLNLKVDELREKKNRKNSGYNFCIISPCYPLEIAKNLDVNFLFEIIEKSIILDPIYYADFPSLTHFEKFDQNVYTVVLYPHYFNLTIYILISEHNDVKKLEEMDKMYGDKLIWPTKAQLSVSCGVTSITMDALGAVLAFTTCEEKQLWIINKYLSIFGNTPSKLKENKKLFAEALCAVCIHRSVSLNVVKILTEKCGINPSGIVDTVSPLIILLCHHHDPDCFDIIRYWVEDCQIDLNIDNGSILKYLSTPVMCSAACQPIHITRYLLEKGASSPNLLKDLLKNDGNILHDDLLQIIEAALMYHSSPISGNIQDYVDVENCSEELISRINKLLSKYK